MSVFGDALKSLKAVVLLEDRVKRLEGDVGALADDVRGLTRFAHDLDKRLYALERIIDIGAQQARQKRIEE